MMIKYISTFCLCLYSCVSYASTSLNVKLENTSTLIVRKDKVILPFLIDLISRKPKSLSLFKFRWFTIN